MTEYPAGSAYGAAHRDTHDIGALALVPWWFYLTLGLLSVAFGLVALIWPRPTLWVFAILVGLWLIVIGIARLLGAFMNRDERSGGQQVLSVVAGILFVLGGVIALRHLVVSLVLIAVFVALQWLFTGVTDIALGVNNRGGHRVWLIIGGVLSIILGIVFLALPGLSLRFFILFTAISALVLGVIQIGVGTRLRTLVRPGNRTRRDSM
jgi:uncharacterized membrane protein HdeD (DUF308 family)